MNDRENERALAALKNWKSWKEDDYLSFLEKHYYAVEKALKQNEKLVEMLALILPMAKGYAHEHNVGSNQHHVNLAVQTLAEYEKGE